MSLWKAPRTAHCREQPGPADTLLAVAFATSSDFVMIEFQVSISILIPTTPERMPRDSDGARIEDGEVAATRKWITGLPVPALIACTSPARIVPTFPWSSRCVMASVVDVGDDLNVCVMMKREARVRRTLVIVEDDEISRRLVSGLPYGPMAK